MSRIPVVAHAQIATFAPTPVARARLAPPRAIMRSKFRASNHYARFELHLTGSDVVLVPQEEDALKRKRYSDEQIVFAPRLAESGTSVE